MINYRSRTIDLKKRAGYSNFPMIASLCKGMLRKSYSNSLVRKTDSRTLFDMSIMQVEHHHIVYPIYDFGRNLVFHWTPDGPVEQQNGRHLIRPFEISVNGDNGEERIDREIDRIFVNFAKECSEPRINQLTAQGDITLNQLNQAFSCIEQHDLTVHKVLMNRRTANRMARLHDHRFDISEPIINLWSATIQIYEDMPDEECLLFSQAEFLGIGLQDESSFGVLYTTQSDNINTRHTIRKVGFALVANSFSAIVQA